MVRQSVVLLGFALGLPAQNIYTVVGGGPPDNVFASQIPVFAPSMTFDAEGNLYVASVNRIYKTNPHGKAEIVAGDGSQFLSPGGVPGPTSAVYGASGLTFVPTGDLFFIAGSSGRMPVYSLSRSGVLANPYALTYPLATTAGAFSMTADPEGNLYFTATPDGRWNSVKKIDGRSGAITTVAGGDEAGYGGDGGPATQARLNTPAGLAYYAGALYVADSRNHRVRRILGGVITTVAGDGIARFSGDGGPALAASLLGPRSVAFSPDGKMLVAEDLGHRVREVASGIIRTVAGTNWPGTAGDGIPATAAFVLNPVQAIYSPQGEIVIAQRDRIRRVSADGLITTIAGNPPAALCGELEPGVSSCYMGLLFAGTIQYGNGALYFISGSLVRKLANGIVSTVAGLCTAGTDTGVAALDACLNPVALYLSGSSLFVSSYQALLEINLQSGMISRIAGGFDCTTDTGPAAATCVPASSLTGDGQGAIYIAQDLKNRIVRLKDGNVSSFAGDGTAGYAGDGGPAANARLRTPKRVLYWQNKLYISDMGNIKVRVVDLASNVITTLAGNGELGFSGDGGSAVSARLGYPYGLAFDDAGNLYIGDTANRRVRRVAPNGIITTFAGNGQQGSGGDGGPAANASFGFPADVVADPMGGLYIADPVTARIRYAGSPPSCVFSLNKTVASVSPQGDTGVAGLTATSASCQWSASSSAPWLKVTSPNPYAGSATVRFHAEPNGSAAARTAVLTVAGIPLTVTQPAAGCASTLTPQTFSVPASGGPLSITIGTAPGCAWTVAAAPEWFSLAGPSAGTSGANLQFSAAANGTGSPRTGSIQAGGVSAAVIQAAANAEQAFTDVPLNHPYFDHIALLRRNAVTSGCSATAYCPDAGTTRGQMAVFIVRSLLGGDTFGYPLAPYFSDVSSSHPYFRHIQKMRELGITAGCTPAAYCPDGVVTRGQMAAFLVRARLRLTAGEPFAFPGAPFFTDVAAAHPFFGFIQKMREMGVTSGCAAAQYCPDAPVSRGQMAVFLIRAFFTP